MATEMNLDKVFAHSEDVVAREIEGELIIIPLVAGIGDMEDELFTLNETGRAIWNELDGQKSLREIIDKLSEEYEVSNETLEQDVIGFVEELLKRKMLVEVTNE